MATKTKGKKKAKAKIKAKAKVKANGAGRMEKIFDCSVTSVIRRLGQEGLSIDQVRNVAKAKGIKMSDKSLSVQVSLGRVKGRPSADLSKDQLSELMELAGEAKN